MEERLQRRGAVGTRRFVEFLRDGEAGRIQDHRREGQMQPDAEQHDDGQRVPAVDRPVEGRQAEELQELGDHADVRLQHEPPHHHGDHLADGVGGEHDRDHQAARGNAAGEERGDPDGGGDLHVDDRVDDDEGVGEGAPEARVGEYARVVVEADEHRLLSVGKLRQTLPEHEQRRNSDDQHEQQLHRGDQEVVQEPDGHGRSPPLPLRVRERNRAGERSRVGEQARGAAGVQEGGMRRPPRRSLAYSADQPGQRLAGIGGIQEQCRASGGHGHRVDRLAARDAVARPDEPVVQFEIPRFDPRADSEDRRGLVRSPNHQRLQEFRLLLHRDPDDSSADAETFQTEDEAARREAGSDRQDDFVRLLSGRPELPAEFAGEIRRACGAQGAGLPGKVDDVRSPAALPNLVGRGREPLRDRPVVRVPRVEKPDLRAEQAVEQEVSLHLRLRRAPEQQDAAPAQMRGRGGRGLTEVRLRGGRRDQRVRAPAAGFREDGLELPRLVAAHREAREVLALHREPGDPDGVRETRMIAQRRRPPDERNARQFGNPRPARGRPSAGGGGAAAASGGRHGRRCQPTERRAARPVPAARSSRPRASSVPARPPAPVRPSCRSRARLRRTPESRGAQPPGPPSPRRRTEFVP